MIENLVDLAYLFSAILFILGLRGLSHPRTALRGNLMGAFGMFLAVVVTLLDQSIVGFYLIIAGLVSGGLVGTLLALRVNLTAMPELVAVFNGFGGGASALIAGAAIEGILLSGTQPDIQITTASTVSMLIGSVTLFGSLVAFGKLRGIVTERPLLIPLRHVVNVILALICLGLVGWLVIDPTAIVALWALGAVAAILGILLVVPIGGADMPVVISLLNSYSGLAAAATGFVLGNNMLIIAGSLVGAAGFILTSLMSRAMNRSLANVLFGGVGAAIASVSESDMVYEGKVKSASVGEVAVLAEDARRVVIVPGYGMAVAQAQYAVRDLTNLLESKGVEVEFAIHPVAGRMPGHMNVLLAEVDISYDKLKEMDEINPSFIQTDLVLVIGANDVVNPMARESDSSISIAGMPILDVDMARAVVVIKRSLSPGFAGIPNPLFAADNVLMLFGDAKKVAMDLANEIGR